MAAEVTAGRQVAAGLGALRRRPRVVARLAGWSAVQAGQSFLLGYGVARAVDGGFLAGRTGAGLGWLALAGVGVLAGALSTGRVYRAVAELVEPLRDTLVRAVVDRALDRAVRGAERDDAAAVSRLTTQTEIARDSLAGLVLVAQTFVFTTAGALFGLLLLAPVLLLVVLPPLLLALAVFAAGLWPLAARQRAVLAADEALAGELGGICAGLRDITACGAEDGVAAGAAARVDGELRAALSLARWGTTRVVALALGGQLPLGLLVCLAPWLLDRGVTAGELVGAVTFVLQGLLPALTSLVRGVGGAGARLAVVTGRLLAEPPAAPPAVPPPVPPDGPPAGPPADGPALVLRGVSFAYGGRAEPVLDRLDLTLPTGGHLAVVGPSGTGKSTLALLVSGLLRPGAGEIVLCGEPLAGRGAAELAGLRVLIPQEAYVFSGTVAENLGYLRPGPPDDDELLAAAAAVGADALVERLGGPGGRVTPAALSAGERQSLALARAYLSPAPVAVLDEATCHLDPAAEARAERAFAARNGGTLIVVAHRISSARRAGRVLLLDGGCHALGSHEELLERSAAYRDLAADWSDPAGAAGYADRVDPVAGTGLPDDGGQVIAHRALGEPQPLRDLRHRGAVGRE